MASMHDQNSSTWEKAYDETSQRYYYRNVSTNEMTWNLPVSDGIKSKEMLSLQQAQLCERAEVKQETESLGKSLQGLTRDSNSNQKEISMDELYDPLEEPEPESSLGDTTNENQMAKQYFWTRKMNYSRKDPMSNEEDELTLDKHFFSLRKRRENVVSESVEFSPSADIRSRKRVVPKSEQIRAFLNKILQQHFLFQQLSSKERLEVVDIMDKKVMEPGFTLIKQGDKGDFFYIVESGEFEIVKSDEEHIEDSMNQRIVGHLKPGSCFGELALLYGTERAATVRSITAAIVWSLDRITFRQILQSSSQHDLTAAREALRKVPLLKALTDVQIEQCAEVVRFREFKQREQIIKKGDVGDVFYIIKSGRVLCSGGFSIHENKESSIELRENDYFGERALLKEEPRAANVYAVTDVTVMTLDRHAFTTILGPLRQVLDDNIRSFVLQEIPVFRCLTPEQRLAVFKAFTTKEYKKGEIIIRQGDIGSIFYVLRSGEAKVTQDVEVKLPDVTEPVTTLLHTLKIGDYFGEMALLDGRKREANVIATEDCTCFCLDRKNFGYLLAPSIDMLNKDATQRRRDNMIKRNIISSRIQREKEIMERIEEQGAHMVHDKSTGLTHSAEMWQKPSREAVKLNKLRIRENLERAIREEEKAAALAESRKLSYISEDVDFASALESRRTNFRIQDLQGIRTIGTGTFGRVKLVRHMHSKQTFALKIQSKAKIVKYKVQQNILNEKAVMESLNHPFINCLHQTFQDQDCLYMLLELIQGGELFSLLQSIGPRLKSHHHRFYIACVISAFEAMHAQDILYRDLKPENLLIDALGYLKVVDFGFAKVVKHRTYTLCGTPEYFSPELVLGKGYGKGNDVWGLGILTYEVMNGFTPFGSADDKQHEIYKKVVQARLLFPKDCYDEIGMQFVSALLQKDVVNRLGCGRYGISALKMHQWFRGLDWLALLKQQIRAPWVPKIKNELDTSHFDVYDEEYRIPPFLCPIDKDPFITF